MTGDVSALASGGCHIFSGCGFPAPGLQDFEWKPFFTIGSFGFTKPMLLAIVAALVVIVFFWAAFRKPKLVPRGVQNLGEMAILAVRDQILRPSLGRKGDSYLPFLVSLYMAKVNPGYLNLLFSTRVGLIMLVTAAALLCAGIFWMRKIVKIDV